MAPPRTALPKALHSICRGCLARPSGSAHFWHASCVARRGMDTFSALAHRFFGWWGTLTQLYGGAFQVTAVDLGDWFGRSQCISGTAHRHCDRHQLCLSSLTTKLVALDRERLASASRFFCWIACDRYHYVLRSLASAARISFDHSRALPGCLSIACDRCHYVFRSLAIASIMSCDRLRCIAIAFYDSRSLPLCLLL